MSEPKTLRVRTGGEGLTHYNLEAGAKQLCGICAQPTASHVSDCPVRVAIDMAGAEYEDSINAAIVDLNVRFSSLDPLAFGRAAADKLRDYFAPWSWWTTKSEESTPMGRVLPASVAGVVAAASTERTPAKEERVREVLETLSREERAFLYILLQDTDGLTRQTADHILRRAKWR